MKRKRKQSKKSPKFWIGIAASIVAAIVATFGSWQTANAESEVAESQSMESLPTESQPAESAGIERSAAATPPRPLLPAARADLPEQVLVRKAYTVSYNYRTKQPNWVAWALTEEFALSEANQRKGSPFHEDEEVPAPRATLLDYKRSGWSRGHLCPAGDCRWDAQALYQTFRLTNICPQSQKLNGGVWNSIEQICRNNTAGGATVYVVTGPMFFNKSDKGTIGPNEIPIPDAFFKVALCVKDGKHDGIGFICRNEADTNEAEPKKKNRSGKKAETYTHTIDEVERITGYDFFPTIDDEIENIVESKADFERWNVSKKKRHNY